MCITEFNQEVYERGVRQEARIEDIENMLKRGKTPEEISDFCGYPLEQVQTVADSMMQCV
jgi:hypothetical protein